MPRLPRTAALLTAAAIGALSLALSACTIVVPPTTPPVPPPPADAPVEPATDPVQQPPVEQPAPAQPQPAAPEPQPAQPAPDTRGAAWAEGPGDMTTAALELSGSYRVNWQTMGDCSYYGWLLGVGPLEDVSTGGRMFSATTATSGESYMYDLVAGPHVVKIITGPNCPWRVDLTPIS